MRHKMNRHLEIYVGKNQWNFTSTKSANILSMPFTKYTLDLSSGWLYPELQSKKLLKTIIACALTNRSVLIVPRMFCSHRSHNFARHTIASALVRFLLFSLSVQCVFFSRCCCCCYCLIRSLLTFFPFSCYCYRIYKQYSASMRWFEQFCYWK